MGLEVSTFIGGLTASWPLAGDLKSQGDDHIRLLKSALQNTFPNSTKAFYFPSAEVISATQALDATDMNNTQLVDTSAGNVAVTLPSGFGTGDKDWKIDIIKTTTDTNAVIVSPSSGTIGSKSGATATIRVGIVCEPATFRWTGAAWICSKPGPMIGSTESYDGVTVPPGYLLDDGSAFSNTAFAELFAVLGSSTLRDKRGRVEAGVDGGQNRLTSTYYGASPVLGAVGGNEKQTITKQQSAVLTYATAITVNGQSLFTSASIPNVASTSGTNAMSAATTNTNLTTQPQYGTTADAGLAGVTQPHEIVQPSIIVQKIKRAC